MGALKCKMCGSNLEIEDSITVCKCEKCGTSQTVPDIEDDKELKLFERAGRLRFNCDFDKAAGIYNTITDSYPEEAEGYWGLVLCKYGIEYADNASGKKVPVCHRISYDSVMDDEDFELVMENSDSESRAIFREEAKIIEENRKKYIQIAESEQPYDIYISYRAKDDNGDKTAVSEIAGHLYNKLTSAGYRVFLSEAALKGKKRSECEPYIYSALNSANVMLALGTSYDDYNDVWVKNEWNRYLEIAEKNKNKCLIPCYKDVDEYDIPKEFAGLKVCQLGNDDTFNNKMYQIEIIEPVNINKLLDEGFSAISDKNWKKANKLFFQVLDEEPDNSKAYWGQLLVQQECTNAREMADNLYLQVIGNTSDNTYELEIRDRRQEIKDKYPVANLFSEEEYANLFDVHFNYQSGVENTKSAIAANNEHYILSDNELFKRAKQNADAEVAAGIEEFVANVNRHLDEILKNVTEQEQQEIEAARQQETAYFSKLEDAFKKAICWNPVDLDSYLGLAECYKNLNMLSRYLDVTKQAYRFCCSRATMARYYRNMGFYYVARYITEAARVCYTYSNIYYKTDNADNELKYLEQALNDKTPEYSVKQMQEILDKNEVEPGPDSKTIGIIYRVGELMMNDKDYRLARDCFSIVYDITQETQLKTLLDELDKDLEDNNA